MNREKNKLIRGQRRSIRSRAHIANADRPRLSVHKTLKHIYAQIIDVKSGVTLVSARDSELSLKGNKSERAEALGKLIAEKAKAKNITSVVFDKGRFKYHGRVKALAEGARANGLEF